MKSSAPFPFQYVDDATIDGQLCTKWAYNVTVFERNNSYVFYATKTVPPKPVYFEMNGYDTLLVSYYDKYVIKYHSFEEWDYDPDDDPDVFEIPHCKYIFRIRGFSGAEDSMRQNEALTSSRI